MGNTYPARFEQTIPGLNYLIDSFQINKDKTWPANNASVQTWTPLLSNGKFGPLEQPTSGNRPTFVENLTAGRPGMKFATGAQSMQATMNGTLGDFTIFLVCKVDLTGTGQQPVYHIGTPTTNGFGYACGRFPPGTPAKNYIFLPFYQAIEFGNASSNTSIITMSWQSSSGRIIARTNGVEELNTTSWPNWLTPSATLNIAPITALGQENVTMFYAAQYDSALGSTDVGNMEQYLSGRFGVSI